MEDLERSLRAHPFLQDLDPAYVAVVVGCAKNVRFPSGSFLFREGDDEHALYLLRQGSVAIEAPDPGRAVGVLETLGPGDVLGISWMKRGTATHFDCRARETVVAFSLDGDCLKRKMDTDPALGYALATRLLERTYERLARARLQKLDVYR